MKTKSIYGKEYNDFWDSFNKIYPNILDSVWYEVCLDFWEDVYNECLSIKENITAAKKYIDEHKFDYD